jgi:hypothetical protein
MRNAFQELKEQAIRFFSLDTGNELLAGFMAGLLTFALLLLIALLLYWIISSRRRAKGIALQAEHGTVFVSARSISDLVCSLEDEFPGIEVAKVNLYNRRHETYLETHLEYQPSDGANLPSLLNEFQKKTLSTLATSFGINSIREVRIRIDRVYSPESAAH